MTPADAVFREAAAERRLAAVPLSHLSIELGHLYLEDFVAGLGLQQHFKQVAPWAKAGRQACVESLQSRPDRRGRGGSRARISTCFLVDDYFMQFSSPAELVPELVNAARAADLELDYLVRESGCADADDVELARSVEGLLVADPPPHTNGSRPPVAEVGWLCNGQRSPANNALEAMDTVRPWTPPVQNAARRHSIFLDVQLWDENHGKRKWSCPFLAAIWHLLRLGMLRHDGKVVAAPRKWEGEFPDDWGRIPPVTQLNPSADPFGAYRTLSILSTKFMPIEHAVRTILSQVAIDRDVLKQVTERSRGEGIELSPELVDRIDYVFAGSSAGQPQ
ncbi:MAG TPA: SCO2522 family protein [Pseudonocardiaceae bacterium]|nr:SCO2522 family protein [Pseudonocardiaceae bacterium]